MPNFINILGQKIDFDFEVDNTAFVGYHSCGAWFNGEYHIIDGTTSDFDLNNGIIRTLKINYTNIAV